MRAGLKSALLTTWLTTWLTAACKPEITKNDEERAPSTSNHLPLEPLSARPLSVPSSIRLHPALGARNPRPVAIVIDRSGGLCRGMASAMTGRAHLICHPGGAASVSNDLQSTLRLFKNAYGPYVAGPPVTVIAGEPELREASLLVNQEPAFFSTLVAWTTKPKPLTPTFLRSFSERKGSRVVLVASTPISPVLPPLAERLGLEFTVLPTEKTTLEDVIDRLARSDERMQRPDIHADTFP